MEEIIDEVRATESLVDAEPPSAPAELETERDTRAYTAISEEAKFSSIEEKFNMSMSTDVFLGGTKIPDNAAVLLAKKKRMQMRRAAVEEHDADFLTLNVDRDDQKIKFDDEADREERASSDGEDGLQFVDDKILIGKNGKVKEQEQRKMYIDDEEEDQEQDEEDAEWEIAQLRKTGAAKMALRKAKSVKKDTVASSSSRICEVTSFCEFYHRLTLCRRHG